MKVVHGLTVASPGGVLQMTPVAERYRREYFEQPHDIFLGERPEEDGSFLPAKVCCMKRIPRKGVYDVLYLEGGLFRADKVAELLVQGDGVTWLSLLSPANRVLVWRCVPEGHASILKNQLLALEARLGLRRSFPIGVVFGAHDQALEEEMFKNDETCVNQDFLNVLGEEIEERSWLHYGSDYLATVESHKAYYTSYCSYEVLFHVAPLLSDDERRQYLGNDKVVIYCLKHGARAFIPRFRGDVYSIGIVCRPDDGGVWDVSVFIRSRIDNFEPVLDGQRVTASQLRRTILSLAVCGYQAVMTSPPYLALLAKAMAAELKCIWPPRERQRRDSFLRRSQTSFTIRQSGGERSSKDKDPQSSSQGSTSPRGRPLHLFSSSPPLPESRLAESPFPGISLRTSSCSPVSGGTSPRERAHRQNKGDVSKLSISDTPVVPIASRVMKSKRISKEDVE